MQILGEWYLCDDGVERPVIRREALAGDGAWAHVEFLVDSGADRSVLDAATWTVLGLPPAGDLEQLGGLGGVTEAVVVDTQIRLTEAGGGKVTFRGRYAAVTEPETLDMSVLGRDILGLFALIVDRPGDLICLLAPRHFYCVERR